MQACEIMEQKKQVGTLEEAMRILTDLQHTARSVANNQDSIFEDERGMARYEVQEIIEDLLSLDLETKKQEVNLPVAKEALSSAEQATIDKFRDDLENVYSVDTSDLIDADLVAIHEDVMDILANDDDYAEIYNSAVKQALENFENQFDAPTVRFAAGYYEWDVLVNNKLFYSFGSDISEDITEETTYLDLEYLIDDCIYCMQEELEDRGKATLPEALLPELKEQMLALWSYHFDISEPVQQKASLAEVVTNAKERSEAQDTGRDTQNKDEHTI